jgi:hypothetical protein
MAFRKLFFKRVAGIRDDYVLEEGDIALDEDDFKLYRGDGSTAGGHLISGNGGIALTDISVTQNSAAGSGTLTYDDSTGVISYTPPASVDATQHVEFTVKNRTGSTLSKGEVVYISGLNGNTPEASLARANSSGTMPAFGLVKADIADNEDGTVVTFGSLRTLNVSNFGETGITFALGDTLYVSSTEAGKLTNVAPAGESNLIQNIGKIERVTPTSNMTIKVGGAGRSNATPNLDEGNVFLGDSNNRAVATSFNDTVDSHLNLSSASTNEVLSYNGSDYAWVAQSGGSSLQSRTTKAGTTGSLADAAQENLDITGFKGYALLKVQTDRAARVRIYTDAASRTADASRAEGSDPAADDGVIAEVITTAAETVLISPGAIGFNNESTPTTTIPCRITNKSGGASTVTVTLHVLQLED